MRLYSPDDLAFLRDTIYAVPAIEAMLRRHDRRGYTTAASAGHVAMELAREFNAARDAMDQARGQHELLGSPDHEDERQRRRVSRSV